MKDKTLIIGIGNTIRGDDIIGILLARELKKENLEGAVVRELETAGFEILDEMMDFERVVILDAMKTSNTNQIGEVVVSSLEEGRPTVTLLPSHGFDFSGLIKAYQKAQPERIPENIKFILVKVCNVDEFREGMSPGLQELFPAILQKVRHALNRILAA